MAKNRKYTTKTKNFMEFFFSIFKSIWDKFLKLPLFLRLCIIILIVIFGLVSPSRLGVYGDKIYQIAKIVLPFYIPGIDIPPYPVLLKVKYSIQDEMGDRELKVADVCKTGDMLTITVQASDDCYFMIICVDAEKIEISYPGYGEATCLKGNERFERDPFPLDEHTGREFYYCIAARKPFSYKNDIEKYLIKIFPDGHTKGNELAGYDLILPSNFTNKRFYFDHIN